MFVGFPESTQVDRASIQSTCQSKYNYMVPIDQQRFQQVFLNYLSNAMKFTDRGGKILVLI